MFLDIPKERMSKPFDFKNLYMRIIYGLLIFIPVFYAVYISGFLFYAVLFIAIFVAGYEYNNMCGRWSFALDGMVFITFIIFALTSVYVQPWLFFPSIILGAILTYITSKMRAKVERNTVIPEHLNRPLFLTIGMVYLAFGFASMGYIARLEPNSVTLMWVFFTVIFNDIAAYIFGSMIKGKKILPKISPNKSWSGLIAAIFFTSVVSYGFAIYNNPRNALIVMFIGALIAIVGHTGDMLESAVKRYLQVKDSSQIIPGHGGLLDRLDAMFLVCIFIAFISICVGKSPLFM